MVTGLAKLLCSINRLRAGLNDVVVNLRAEFN